MTNIGRKDFEILAHVLKIAATTSKRIINKYLKNTDQVFKMIDQSYVSDTYKVKYKNLWVEKLKKLTE